ncbi:MAG: glycosyltransferase [Bacteroidota bacterium]
MKNVAIITDIDFWRKGAGNRARLDALVNYLKERTCLTIIFAGVEESEDLDVLNNTEKKYELIYLERKRVLDKDEYVKRLVNVFQKYRPDVCIVEYLYLAFVRQFIPDNVLTILDTHDLTSERRKTFEVFGYAHEPIDFYEEIRIFSSFHKTMLIQRNEFVKVAAHMDNDSVLLSPHPVEYSQQTLRKEVRKIGFVGSSFIPNIDGMKWFLEKVFPIFNAPVELHIYGQVSYQLYSYRNPNIFFHGLVDSVKPIYDEMDIMINPVRFGAGLKIKNIEALGNGLPLVTHSHGAAGMESQINKSFLTGDDPISFLEQLNCLIEDRHKRVSLGNSAYSFIKENFSPSKCFGSLMEIINDSYAFNLG